MQSPHQQPNPQNADVVQLPITPSTQSVGDGGKRTTPKITQWIVLGVVAIAVFQSCQKPVQQQQTQSPRPVAPTQAQPTPVEQGIPREDIPQAVVRRNALMQEAIALAEQVHESTVVTRAEYFLLEAQQNLEVTNQPIEDFLLTKLQEVNSKNQAITAERSQLAGDAEQIAIARSLNGDALALLLALQQVQSGKTNLSLEAIAPAKSILTIQQYTEISELLRQSSPESRLIQQSVEPNQQPPVVP